MTRRANERGRSEPRRSPLAGPESEPALVADAREAPARALTRLSPQVRRVIAPNASPFTLNGTCTYIVGEGAVAIVDPGPDDETHHRALLAAVEGAGGGVLLV